MKTRPVLTLEDCLKVHAAAEAEARTAAVSRRSSGRWERLIKDGRTGMLNMPGIDALLGKAS